ncbi:MAG: 4Fe-4S binding protein, partial [Ferruginibacter sp.]|nr:4Fe-4S binding protein [Ferruginibacter sp.]
MIFIISPILTYFYGKRWYCSWVCGCGGLAETAGDPFRHLSDKSLKAWKIERWLIHTILALVTVVTVAVLFTMFYDNPSTYWLNKKSFSILVIILFGLIALILLLKRKTIFKDFDKKAYIIALSVIAFTVLCLVNILLSNGRNVLFLEAGILRQWYGFFIASIFSGVIGVGFYPIMGSRVWCRFGCPMAAILGFQQKFFSRFRITTNGSQCISCGNCSTYCEMGIDVRAYAQKGQDIVRSSCVGCGVCSTVCPRGVLKLENGPIKTKKLVGPIQYVNGAFEVTK